jgi:hypothetical protein
MTARGRRALAVLVVLSIGVVAGSVTWLTTNAWYVAAATAAAITVMGGVVGPPIIERILKPQGLVKPRDALKSPYEPLSKAQARRSPSLLLLARHRAVRFHSREEQLDSLVRWCREGPRTALALVAGPAGIGKTRLGAQLSQTMKDEGWLS